MRYDVTYQKQEKQHSKTELDERKQQGVWCPGNEDHGERPLGLPTG